MDHVKYNNTLSSNIFRCFFILRYVGLFFLLFFLARPLKKYCVSRHLTAAAAEAENPKEVILQVSSDRASAILEHFEIEIERINTFSDGVFAIVATLFTLTFRVRDDSKTLDELVSFNFNIFANLVSKNVCSSNEAIFCSVMFQYGIKLLYYSISNFVV